MGQRRCAGRRDRPGRVDQSKLGREPQLTAESRCGRSRNPTKPAARPSIHLSGPPFSLTHDLKKVFRKRERKPSPLLVGKAWRVLVMIGIQSEWKTGEEDPIEAGGCGMSSYVPPRVTS